MPKLKVAVIVDRGEVKLFGLCALDSLRDCDEISVFSCLNSSVRRRPFRHFGYHALSLLFSRNPHARHVPVAPESKRVTETVEFRSGHDGAWQTLPAEIVAKLAGFDVIVKLGMGLIRVPSRETLPAPILAWHHGDPDHFRGQPAGFWEIAHRSPVMGQVVQILSHESDSPRIVAFAQTKVHAHSYKATLIEAYRHSHLLLNEAVRNALAGSTVPKASIGKDYRLPSNLAVLGFAARRAAASAKRLAYSAVADTGWRISLADFDACDAAALVRPNGFPAPEQWRTLPTPRGYAYLADPFFSREPAGILVEALRRGRGTGDIGIVSDDRYRQLSEGKGHFSYPATVEEGGEQLIVPEMAQWGQQRCFRVRDDRMEEAGTLDIEGRPRLLDPTLIEHEGRLYLFGNDENEGSTALHLWSASSLRDAFRRHPFSPVLIDPCGGRMAGALLRSNGRLLRFGQSFLGDYGDGVMVFEVEKLTPGEYRESAIGMVRFADRLGPHTLNFDGGRILFDWYTKRYSALAGVRRTMARLSRPRDVEPSRVPGTPTPVH